MRLLFIALCAGVLGLCPAASLRPAHAAAGYSAHASHAAPSHDGHSGAHPIERAVCAAICATLPTAFAATLRPLSHGPAASFLPVSGAPESHAPETSIPPPRTA
ncbi:hypothetical protein ACFSCV_17770 [Methylopila henanensis]|uniref:Cobalt transporter n=1 Tax=Methylopila henanensis TaxID=873516 RepID=A0ABW4KCT9_9HYPH